MTADQGVHLELECPICGDIAYVSPTTDGLAYEDDGERCASCGIPGHVNVSEDMDGNDTAYWWADEESPEAVAYFEREEATP